MRAAARKGRLAAVLVCAALLAALVTTASPVASAGAQEDPTAKLSPALVTIADTVGIQSTEDLSVQVGLPASGAGSLLEGDGGFLVYVRMAPITPDGIAGLEAAGATIVHVSERYQVVTAAMNAGTILPAAEVGTVSHMSEVLEPMVNRSPAAVPTQEVAIEAATCPTGVVSEGDTQLKAAIARATFGVDGSGLKIGILSDSFAQVTSPTSMGGDIAAAELPGFVNPCGYTTDVTILHDHSGKDEGRAMAQAIHDLAPGAEMGFATAFSGEFAFAAYIEELRAWGADVIVDDVIYFDEPFFQDGPVAVAVNEVVADGAVYLSSAGNDNETSGTSNISSYETPAYRPTACPASITSSAPKYASATCHDFDPSGLVDVGWDFTAGGATSGGADLVVNLQWSEPWYGVTDDFAIFYLDAATDTAIGAADNYTNTANGVPFELLRASPSTGQSRRVVIVRVSGSGTPRLKFLTGGSRNLTNVQYATVSAPDIADGSSVFGHAGAAGAIAVAAVPYNDPTTPEPYTSRGDVTHYWGPVTGGADPVPASPLASAEVIAKPQVAATDGGRNSFFGNLVSGVYRFYGTSQAAPHAAAITALLLQRTPTLTPAQVRTALQTTAVPVANGGTPQVVGAGLVDAYAATLTVGGPIASPPPRNVTATAGNTQAAVSWTAPVSDGGSTITGYTVTSSPGNKTCTWTTGPLTCTVTGLTNGTAYTFTAVATNGIGPSAASAPSPTVTPSVPVISVVRGGDNAMYWQRLTDTSSTAWASRGGGTSGRPQITSNGTKVWAFVRGLDGTPYWQRNDGGQSWTNWAGLGGFLKSDPIALVNGTKVFVAGVGGDNGVYWGTLDLNNNSQWSGWNALGGGASANPALTKDGAGVVIVVRGIDGTPYQQRITSPGGGSGWFGLGGGIQGSPAAVTETSGKISIFVRGNDNNLYRQTRNSSPNGWSGWQAQGGAWSTAPAAVADSNGVAVVLNTTGGTPTVVRFATDGGNKGPTVSLGGFASADPAVTTDGTTTWVFIRGGDMQSYWRRGTGATWTGGWTPTGGFLTSGLSSGTSS